MTIKFYEFGNSVVFDRHEIEKPLPEWEEAISVGDSALYHDSRNGTRPLGHVVSVSPNRKYLLVRLASYELFIILRKVRKNEYLVLKSDIRETLASSAEKYYGGTAALQNVYWETDPAQKEHVVFLWYLHGEQRLYTDIVTLLPVPKTGELVDYISGRYELTE